MQENALKKASTYYLIGTLFNKGFAFLTVPIFTRILSTADYGVITTYDSWIGILSTVMGFAIYMGIRSSFVDYPDRVDDFLSVCISFTLFSGAVMILAVGGGILLLRYDINFTLVFLCLLQGLASAIIQDYSMYLMMKFDYKFRTALMILPNLISAAISIGVILLITRAERYMGRIVPTALVHIGVGAMLVFLTYKKSRLHFDRKFLKYALSISAPLVLHGVALNILSQSDRTMITVLASPDQTGIYSLIYNFGMVAVVITTSLEGVWVPWFYDRLKQGERDAINMAARDYIHFMTYAMIGVVAVGPEVVKLLASRQYWEGISIIPPIVLSNYVVFAYTLYVNVEHFHRKTLYITYNTLLAAGCNLLLNYILIPRYGYVAAAYTTLISYFFAFVLHASYAKKLEHGLYPLKTFLWPLTHLIIAVIVFYVFVDQWYIRWIAVGIYLIGMAVKERNRIFYYFPQFRRG